MFGIQSINQIKPNVLESKNVVMKGATDVATNTN